MAGYPVVFVDAGGLPVTYGSDENGWPIEEAASGLPVTIVSSGGLPVVEGVGAVPYILAGLLQSNEQGYTAPGSGDPAGVDYTIDTQDARMVEFDTGRGAELAADPTFQSGVDGYSTPNGAPATVSVSNGVLSATGHGGANPYITKTFTGLEIGATYEAEIDSVAYVTGLSFSLATAVISGTRFHATAAVGLRRVWRPRWVATSTTHSLVIASVGTPTGGQKYVDLHKASLKKVLTSGISYPPALETSSPYKDPSNFAAMGTSPNMTFGRQLLASGRASRVIQYNAAIGGAGLVGNRWDPDTPGDLYTPFVTGLTALVADNPNARIVLTTFGGEWDATVGGISKAAYEAKFVTLISNLRAIPGCANMRVLVSTLIPEYADATPSVAVIVSAQRNLPNLIGNLAVVETPTGYQKTAEPYHLRATGSRAVGALRYAAL